MSKTWFITGTSRGFGREWAIAALERGDRVAATARNTASLDDLVEQYGDLVLPLELDVTDHDAAFAAVRRAHQHFGALDVAVNNAGYGQFGMIEELSESEARAQIETNLFGALWVTQAAVEIMREQGSGHLIQVSSIGGISAFPTVGIYHASKWALEGFSQALAQEVAGFGIKVTLVEPGGFSTDWSGDSAKHATAIDAYDSVREAAANRPSRRGTPGDPVATRGPILTLVDAEDPPLRAFFGEAPLAIAKADYESRLASWEKWQPLAVEAHGGQGRVELMELQGARVLVVGATGVLGGLTARALVDAGAQVVVSGRDAGRLAEIAAFCGTDPLPLDLVDVEACAATVDAAAQALGGLDGLVVATGVAGFGPAVDADPAIVEELFAVNALGPMALVRAAAPHLTASETGGFAAVLSAILADLPTAGMAEYGATKAALSSWLGVVRRENRRRFSVIDLRPPHLDTGLAERALVGEPPRLPAPLSGAVVADALLEAVRKGKSEVVWDQQAGALSVR